MNEIIYGLPVGQAETGILPAGYYTSEQRGRNEEKYVLTWYHGTESMGMKDEYWQDEKPMNENQTIY